MSACLPTITWLLAVLHLLLHFGIVADAVEIKDNEEPRNNVGVPVGNYQNDHQALHQQRNLSSDSSMRSKRMKGTKSSKSGGSNLFARMQCKPYL